MWCLLLIGGLASAPAAEPVRSLDELKGMAEACEKQGAGAEALRAYEQIVQRDPSTRSVLSRRMVELYAQTRQPQRALELARETMKSLPDPQAYLASVYVLVGGYPEARAILDKELATEQTARRKVALNWQLAEMCEKTGDAAGVKAALAAAAEAAKGTPDEPAAKRQVDAMEKRASVKP